MHMRTRTCTNIPALQVDDYLMLSSSRASAEALLTRLSRGFPE